MGFFKFLLILLLLSSCSVERQAARLIRHAKKDLDKAALLGFPHRVDTIYSEKLIKGDSTTIQVPVDRMVTAFKDTVIFQDRIRIKIKTVRDTVRIRVVCPDSVIRVPVVVKESINCPNVGSFWKSFGISAGVFSLLMLLLIVLLWRSRK